MVYQNIIFLQGDSALEALELLSEKSHEDALEYLKQWDHGDNEIETNEVPWGTRDRTFKSELAQNKGYIMSYNLNLGYIGLINVLEE